MDSPQKFKTLKLEEKEFQSLSGLWKVDRVILDTLNFEELAEKVTNVVLTELNYLKLGYSIIVLTLIDKAANTIKRISISKTKAAKKALEETPIPFEEIIIPLTASKNLLVKAVRNKRVYFTHDLSDVLYPVATRDIWRQIQNACGIKTSMVYPIISKGKTLGAMIFSLSKGIKEISRYEKEVLAGFTNAVGLAVENASLYRRLREANRRLRELDRLKDEFVSVASHELRTPMTSINNYLWMVLHDKAGEISKKQKLYLDRASISSQRLIALVNDMLTISRIQRGKIELKTLSGNIVALTKMVIEDLKSKAIEKKIKIDLELPKKRLPQVLLDKERIREVLVNLISNALKFTPEKGEIVVSFKRKGKWVTTLVADNGPGIAQEDIPKLFKKFGRLDRSFATIAETGGTGLGLYICKQIIDLHHGKIGVKSELGKGSTFYFSLRMVRSS